MNFPENPLFEFLYWLINTPPVGGIAVILVGAGCILAYGLILHWIVRGREADEHETYAYPTPTLHHDH